MTLLFGNRSQNEVTLPLGVPGSQETSAARGAIREVAAIACELYHFRYKEES
jgi:hypothetical protein